MNDENWKEDYKKLKPDLKPYQIKLLDDGAQSNSQTLLLSDMWLEWKDLSAKRKLTEIANDFDVEDPLDENVLACKVKRTEIGEELLKLVPPVKYSTE